MRKPRPYQVRFINLVVPDIGKFLVEVESRVKKVLDLGYKTLYVDIVCSSEPEILEVSIVNRVI